MQNKEKNILLVTDVMINGGVDTYVSLLSTEAIKNGWNVLILIDENSKSAITKNNLSNIKIYYGKIYHRKYSKEEISYSVSELLKIMPKINLCHIICGISWSCITVRELLIKRKIPIVNTEQFVPQNINFSITDFNCLKKIYNKTEKIIFVEKYNLDILKNLFGKVVEKRSCIIHNAIGIEAIEKKSTSVKSRKSLLINKIQSNKKLKLLFIGRLTEQKGLDVLLEALQRLKKNVKENIQFDIYGSGDLEHKIYDIINRTDLYNFVAIYPWTNNILDLLNSYDFFIFPSKSEGLSFMLLEALASNIPALISNIPSNLLVSDNGKYAEVFNVNSVEDLSYKINKFVSNPLESMKRVIGRKEWLQNNFDIRNNLGKTINIWNKIYYEQKI